MGNAATSRPFSPQLFAILGKEAHAYACLLLSFSRQFDDYAGSQEPEQKNP
jgi:hypothetical protein